MIRNMNDFIDASLVECLYATSILYVSSGWEQIGH
jgi:hypothetical protein